MIININPELKKRKYIFSLFYTL